jgi:hypothetical protein
LIKENVRLIVRRNSEKSHRQEAINIERFEVYRVVKKKEKIMVFWVMILCSAVDGCHCFERTYCLHLQGRTEGGVEKFLKNNDNYRQDYAAS